MPSGARQVGSQQQREDRWAGGGGGACVPQEGSGHGVSELVPSQVHLDPELLHGSESDPD